MGAYLCPVFKTGASTNSIIKGLNHGSRRRSNSSTIPLAAYKVCCRGLLPRRVKVGVTFCILHCSLNVVDLDPVGSLVADPSRNLLYALTAKNVIHIYKPNGEKSVQHLQTLSNLCKNAQDKAPGSPALAPQNFHIDSLHVVSPAESRAGVQLFAITTNGVRLFFGPSAGYGFYGSSSSGSRPLALIHVRLPPTNLIHPDEQAKPFRPPVGIYGAPTPAAQSQSRPYLVSNLDNPVYINGLTIAAQPGDADGSDYVLCLAPDLTHIGGLGNANLPPVQQPQQQYATVNPSYHSAPSASNRPPLFEYATLLSIPGRTWAAAILPPTSTASSPANTPSPSSINELATQFSEPSSQFLLLTNVGLTFLIKRRAVDYLKAVLEELHTEGTVQQIVEFRDRFVIQLS